MAILGDEDIFGQVQAPKYNRQQQNAITAGPAQLSFDSPAVSTYNPQTGYTPWSGTPVAQDTYNTGGVSYPAAQQNFAPQNGAAQAPATPAPPVGGATYYNNLDSGGKAAADAQWLGGDSDYTAQLGEYQRALDDFVKRITAQKAGFDTDADNAINATNQNEQYAGNSLGEDFGARGMSYSGLFDKSKNDLTNRYKDQRSNIDLVRGRNKDEATNRQADYEAENSIGRANAKRSALARMAAQQQLVDQGAGL